MTLSIPTPRASLHRAAIRFGSVTVRALVAIAFIIAGTANISSTPSVIEMFEAVGVGQWLRYLAALLEVAGAAMLLLPDAVGLGALLLTATMVCALLGQVFVPGDTGETLVLLAAASGILWHRRRELIVLYRRHLGRRRFAGVVTADLYAAFFWVGVGTCLGWSAMIAVFAFELVR